MLWVAAGALAVQAAPAAAEQPVPCPQRGSKMIAVDGRAIIYKGVNGEGLEEVLGCVRGTTRRYGLGAPPSFGSAGGGGVTHERLAGVMAAYEEFSVFEGEERSGHFRVLVRDLQTGRLVHRVLAGPSKGPYLGGGKIDTLVVAPGGSAAWIRREAGTGEDELRVVDHSGVHVLASGGGIVHGSLTVRGTRLSWTRNGERFSYTLR